MGHGAPRRLGGTNWKSKGKKFDNFQTINARKGLKKLENLRIFKVELLKKFGKVEKLEKQEKFEKLNNIKVPEGSILTKLWNKKKTKNTKM